MMLWISSNTTTPFTMRQRQMRSEKLQDAIGEIDSVYIEDAHKEHSAPKPAVRLNIARYVAAACMLLLVAGGVILFAKTADDHTSTTDSEEENTADIIEAQAAVSIGIDGYDRISWSPIAFDERKFYGLVPPDSEGLTPENTYEITEADLGEPMGTVDSGGSVPFDGNMVYHFAARPDSLGICVVDTGKGYEFYCTEGLYVEDVSVSDALLSAYGLPERCAYAEIQQPDGTPIFRLTARDDIEKLCALIANRSDIGHDAAERRFSDAWREAYGNDNVYYSEEEGCVLYKDDGVRPEERTYTAEDGTEITEYTYPEGYKDLYDTASELWSDGERLIVLYNTEDLRLWIDYFPSIHTIIAQDGYYDISGEDADRLAELLYRDQ